MSANDREGDTVLVVGGQGEFGRFLREDILPGLRAGPVAMTERETPRDRYPELLGRARHVVLTTPLAGYAERACELVYQCRDLDAPATLWFIPSVQAGVWRAVTATLTIVGNARLSAVFAHPMYGPNGFRATEPEARTFQNVLTATHEGDAHPLGAEVALAADAFRDAFNITTTSAFDPEEHDRITAYSQGLSYCVGRLMFERPDIDALVRASMPDLHHSFHANRDLIGDFLRINAYMPQVAAAFADGWRRTAQATYADVLRAFAEADAALNRGADSPIPTKWYEQLHAASLALSAD
jgi:prephenate dehydrogenase